MRKLPRAEVLVPIAVALGAVVLAASEFMIAFAFTPPGGEALREVIAPLHDRTGRLGVRISSELGWVTARPT